MVRFRELLSLSLPHPLLLSSDSDQARGVVAHLGVGGPLGELGGELGEELGGENEGKLEGELGRDLEGHLEGNMEGNMEGNLEL